MQKPVRRLKHEPLCMQAPEHSLFVPASKAMENQNRSGIPPPIKAYQSFARTASSGFHWNPSASSLTTRSAESPLAGIHHLLAFSLFGDHSRSQNALVHRAASNWSSATDQLLGCQCVPISSSYIEKTKNKVLENLRQIQVLKNPRQTPHHCTPLHTVPRPRATPHT